MRSEPERRSAVGRLPRRVTDHVEDAVAWVLLAVGLLLVMIAGVIGLGAFGRESERAELESGSRTQVRAAQLEDAPFVAGDVGERLPVRAVVHWTDRNGLDHSGVVDVGGPKRAGAEVEMWVDAAGEAVPRPVRPVNTVRGPGTASTRPGGRGSMLGSVGKTSATGRAAPERMPRARPASV